MQKKSGFPYFSGTRFMCAGFIFEWKWKLIAEINYLGWNLFKTRMVDTPVYQSLLTLNLIL